MAKQRFVWLVLTALAIYLVVERLPAERLDWRLREAEESLNLREPARAEVQFRKALDRLGSRTRRRSTQARALEGLARSLQAQARHPEALKAAQQALEAREAAAGRQSPAVADTLQLAAQVQEQLGEYRHALESLDRALAIDRAKLGPFDPRCASVQNQRSLVLTASGDLPRAEAAARQAVAILERIKLTPAQRELLAEATANLGWTELLQGKLDKARPHIERGRGMALVLYSTYGLRMAGFHYKKAVLENQAGDYYSAEREARAALHILTMGYGVPDQTLIAVCSSALGQALMHDDRDSEAEPHLRHALALHERLLGANHPETAIDLRNLAHLLEHQQKLSEAETLATRALAIDESARGPNHYSTAVSLTILAEIRLAQDRPDEARRLLERARDITRQSTSPTDPFLARILVDEARLEEKADHLEAAEKLYANALTLQENGLSPHHPAIAKTLDRYATLLRLLHRASEAEALEARAKQLREEHEEDIAPFGRHGVPPAAPKGS